MSNYEDIIYQIALTLIPGIGPSGSRTLLKQVDHISDIFSTNKDLVNSLPGLQFVKNKQELIPQALHLALKEYEFIEKYGIQTYFLSDRLYPARLRQCSDAPLLLYAKGAVNLNPPKMVSVVGTRHATQYGMQLCEELIQSFRDLDIVVVSGLAHGIDGIVHRLCVKYDVPTIAVLAHGLDTVYPSQHVKLAKQMQELGGLITEYLPKTIPDRAHFPMRNRIVAGVSDATIVVESAQKGGSLITAKLAADYDRDVYAFPGNIGQTYSVGCHELIQTNIAQLIVSGNNFLDYMNWISKNPQEQMELFFEPNLEPLQNQVWQLFKESKTLNMDSIALELGIPISQLSEVLFQLEMKNLIKSLPGNQFVRSN